MTDEVVRRCSSRDGLAHRRGVWAAALMLVLGLLAAPSVGAADTGFYASFHAGPNFLPEIDPRLDFGIGSAKLDLDYNPGFNVGGAVGYQFPKLAYGRFRLEGEVDYQRHSLDDAKLKDVDLPPFIDLEITSTSGHAQIISVMSNVYFDFDLGWLFEPFVGVGAGVAWADIIDLGGNVEANLPSIGEIKARVNGGSEVVLAGQVMAGFGYALSDRWKFSASYRGFFTSEATFKFDEIDLPGIDRNPEYKTDIASHGVRFELRYLF